MTASIGTQRWRTADIKAPNQEKHEMFAPHFPRWLAIVLLFSSVVLSGNVEQAVAQDKLEDVIKETGFSWMIGRWAATSDEGQTMQVTFRWALDRHVVRVNFTTGEYIYDGMIFYVPDEEKVVEVGADNRGGSSQGTWQPEGDRVVSISDKVQANGEKMKVAIYHSKAAAKTMTIAMHAVDDAGEIADEAWGTFEFKRQPRKPGQKKKPAGAVPAAGLGD